MTKNVLCKTQKLTDIMRGYLIYYIKSLLMSDNILYDNHKLGSKKYGDLM